MWKSIRRWFSRSAKPSLASAESVVVAGPVAKPVVVNADQPLGLAMVDLLLPVLSKGQAKAAAVENAIGNFAAAPYGQAVILQNGRAVAADQVVTITFDPGMSMVYARVGDPQTGQLVAIRDVRFPESEQDLQELNFPLGRDAAGGAALPVQVTPGDWSQKKDKAMKMVASHWYVLSKRPMTTEDKPASPKKA